MASTSRRSAMLLASAVALPAALLAALAAYWLGGGFDRPQTGPVPVAAPPSPEPRCATLIAALPRVVDGADARPVRGAATSAAAWGDPPIVLRCGVPKPTVAKTAQLLGVEGIMWVTVDTADGVVWTSTDLAVPVEVRVPEEHREAAGVDILNPLAKPLKAALR